MRLHHHILGFGYPFFRVVRSVEKLFGYARRDRLRVLLYHDVAADQLDSFARQLRWLQRRWRIISPTLFTKMMSGEEPIVGQNVLLSFDDGFISNRAVAEEVLDPMNIRALFFVVSDFAVIEDRKDASNFISSKIYPNIDRADLPNNWSNMRLADLEILLENGHVVGGHTKTHSRLSVLTAKEDLEREICGSAEDLERLLNVRVEHFAYPFGDLVSISPAALEIASKRFRFVYSGLRGDNTLSVSPHAIRRDAVTACDNTFLLGSFLEGGADFHYKQAGIKLDAWTKHNAKMDTVIE